MHLANCSLHVGQSTANYSVSEQQENWQRQAKEKHDYSAGTEIKLMTEIKSEMNRTERQGRRTVRRIRSYTNKWLAITLRFLPRRSSTSLFVVSCVRRSALAHCRQRRKRNDESRGRNNKRRQKRNTKANPVFLLTILLRLITARRMSLAGKRFVSTENRTECQVPATFADSWTQYIIQRNRTAKSNWGPFACQLGNSVSSYHHNQMTRAASTENL